MKNWEAFRRTPRSPLVYEGIRLCREHGLGLVLAVGGGSVIDSAKAIALGVPYEGDVWELYLSKKQPQSNPLPVATVLTIPAAGSESSPNTVITNEETRRKLGYGSPNCAPYSALSIRNCSSRSRAARWPTASAT